MSRKLGIFPFFFGKNKAGALMEKLLDALEKNDEGKVNELACELFITNDGHCHWGNIMLFEKFADCKIVPLERDSFGWLIGGIKYKGKTFSFG